MDTARAFIDTERQWGAPNYASLPVVLQRGRGAEVWDVEGNRYLDFMSAYSAANFGHCHPRIVRALTEQVNTLDIVSRAFHSDKLGAFLQKACETTGHQAALPMNTGAEAVETAMKAARKWGYERKGITPDQAEIICCANNFHGRTTGIISMSTSAQARGGFGPYLPGIKPIPFNDADALAAAITRNTAAFLVEPIQGEAGIIVPSADYLARCARICKAQNVLLIADEIQTGLGRAGHALACHGYDVQPDAVVIGKSLGGGAIPVSLFLARRDVMDVLTPGCHGSTFGGYPLAGAVGLEALSILEDEDLCQRALDTGGYLIERLRPYEGAKIKQVRGRGLMIGVELHGAAKASAQLVTHLRARGILCKNVDSNALRLAPPLNIPPELVEEFLHAFEYALERL